MWDDLHPIYRAALDGDADAVKHHIASGASVDLDDSEDNWTPLHCAAMKDHENVVRLLLDHGADPVRQDRFRMTPFDTAVSHGATRVASLLYDLTLKDDPDSRGTILHAAVTLGLTDLVSEELRAGADPNRGGDSGATPLHQVFTHTSAPEKMARIILLRRRSLTPGPSLLPQRRVVIAKLLLDAGADPTRRDRANWSSVRIAIHDGHHDLLDLFLQRGLDLKAEAACGFLVDAAAHGGQAEMIRFLAKKGLDVDGPGHTPLHTAAWMAFPDCISALLECGANPNLHFPSGPSALDEARRRLKSEEENIEFLRRVAATELEKSETTRGRCVEVCALLERAGAKSALNPPA